MVVWEKMKWELERGGWVAGNGDLESIERVERREALGRYWDKFGCYLLLESLVLRRMDGSVALTCVQQNEKKELYTATASSWALLARATAVYVLLIGLSSFPMGGPPSYHHHSFILSSTTDGPYLCRHGACS
uniref:Uncharacterized protein n=1 Tax=Oryza nivara TaxID=4536 RepID=A0A0E0IBS5_ORYNI